jgi:hypothetical protein
MKLILIILILSVADVFAAQFAIVKSEKAVIYADHKMTSAIGYIVKGKKIEVGEVARNKGTVLPTVVSGKIVWIQVKDIMTAREKEHLETVTDKAVRGEQKQRHESVTFGYIYSNYAVASSQEAVTNQLTFTGFEIKGHVQKIEEITEIRAGMEYVTGESEKQVMRILNFNVDITYPLLSLGRLVTRGVVGMNFSPYVSYSYDDEFTKNGNGAGIFAGLETSYRFTEKIKLSVDASYQYFQTFSMNLPDEFSGADPSLSGVHLLVGFNYLL